MNEHPAVVPSSRRGKKPPVRRKGGRAGLPAGVSGRHVVRGRQSSPILECAQVTGKADENGQYSGEVGGSSAWTRPSVPECGDTLTAQAGDQRLIWSGDRLRRRLRGRYPLGHRSVVLLCTETAQCTVRPT